MGILDLALAPLRAALGNAEREADQILPVREIEEIQTRLLDTGHDADPEDPAGPGAAGTAHPGA